MIRQILEVFKSDNSIMLTIVSASGAGALLFYLYPSSLIGLPEWVKPTFLLVFAVSAAALLISTAQYLWRKFWTSYGSRWAKLFRDRSDEKNIKAKLLDVEVHQLIILCCAKTQGGRICYLNMDHPSVMGLVDMGIIKRIGMSSLGDRSKTPYQINESAWRLMFQMREYHIERPHRFAAAVDRDNTIADVLEYLPEEHGAVQAFKAVQREENGTQSQ